jgi:hypothetical protein
MIPHDGLCECGHIADDHTDVGTGDACTHDDGCTNFNWTGETLHDDDA